ncbi:type II toxin-antitoxin system RelE/ParE family toxin, partial [Patescibacteria group bacterium]|nr:type II toxin-antitoxin system RelE/ParE family toxin [Patescibacteria group bacterium]
MYQLRIRPKALKELKRIRNQRERNRISQAFLEIRKNPFIGKKLSGEFKGSYSLRVWSYRII